MVTTPPSADSGAIHSDLNSANAASAEVPTAASSKSPPSPEDRRADADARAATFGRVLALLMASPRHANMTLADANAYVAPAIALGQISLMGAKPSANGPLSVAAAVWWAFVSPEVDKRLSESRDAHLKLEPKDWRSGDQPWVIETIGDQRVISELVKRLAENMFKGKPAKIRAVLPDGRTAVGHLQPRPASSEPAKS